MALSGLPSARDHSTSLCFDGVLADRSELELSLGRRAGIDTDASLVLAAYAAWGEDALPRLRGSFAFCLVDHRRNCAIAARDPLGSHPLFFATTPVRTLFAALPADLLAEPDVPRDLNRAALADHLCSRWPDRTETFFEAVRRVPPGWRAVLHGGNLSLSRHWNPVPEGQAIEWLTPAEVARFDEVLDRAVNRCLKMGRTGVYLSGGLDSISVAALAADAARRQERDLPLALSIAFPHAACDEREVQMAVAERLGIEQEIVGFRELVGPNGLHHEGVQLSQRLAHPLYNTWAPAYLRLAGIARTRGVEAVMTGNGGDEGLGVSPYLSADLLRSGQFGALFRFMEAWQRSYKVTWPQVMHSALWTFGVRPLGSQLLTRWAGDRWEASRRARFLGADPEWVAPSAELRRVLRERAAGSLGPSDPPGGFYLREAFASLDNVPMSWDLEEQYQFRRWTGVRLMHPYWDPDLQVQIFRTPPDDLNAGGRSKGLVRQTLAKRFPTLGFDRQRKVSAVDFYQSELRRELPSLVSRLGPFESLERLGVIDGQRTSLLTEQPYRSEHLHKLWSLINLEMWTRQLIV